MKRLFIYISLTILLSGCSIAYRSVEVPPTPIAGSEPPGAPADTPIPGATKVVSMVTDTPAATYTPTAYVPRSASSPTPYVITQNGKPLSEWGIDYTTFRDSVTGFEFDYPAGWVINDLSDAQKKDAYVYTVSLHSNTPTAGPKQQDSIPPGMTAIDVTIFKEGPKTLEQAVNERRAAILQPESGQPPVITREEEWTLPGGLPAHRFLLNTGPEVLNVPGPDRMVSVLVTMIQGRMVLVTGQGDMSLFNGIASSLREVQ